MKLFQVLVALAILSGSMISISTAKPAYGKKEGKKCTYCHTTAGKPDLNDIGKCYQKSAPLDKEGDRSLAKCSAPAGN